MSKTLKKVLIFLLALIIVLVVIFLIEILLPKNTAGEPSPASPSASQQPTPSTSVSGVSPAPSPADMGSVMTEETADGRKYTVTVPGSFVTYTLTADSALFEHAREDGGDFFRSLEDEQAFINIDFIPDVRASGIAPGYLDAFIDYTEFEQSGQNLIDGTTVSGETVTAGDGVRQVTAWLVNTNKGVLAVVMSLTLADKEDALPKLDKALSTFAIID